MFLDIRFLRGELFLFAIQFRQRTTELPKLPLPHNGLFNREKGRTIGYSYLSQKNLTI